MSPDSFSGKILLNVLDKLILGTVAALLVAFFQYKSQEYQKLLDQTVTVSKIHTDILIQQRKNLTEVMQQYFLLLEKIKPVGRVTHQDDIKSLSKLLHETRLVMSIVGAMDQRFEKDGRSLLESISEMNVSLLGETNSPKQIESMAEDLRKKYGIVLVSLRDVTVDSVKNEFKAARPRFFL